MGHPSPSAGVALAVGSDHAHGPTGPDRRLALASLAMAPTIRRLLVLPAGLLVGHHLASIGSGHAPGQAAWAALGEVLLCVAVPMAAVAVAHSVRDGWQGRTDRLHLAPLVVQHAVAFLGLELVEHLVSGASPWGEARHWGFWLALGAHVVAGLLAWATLRLAHRVGHAVSTAGRPARTQVAACASAGQLPGEAVAAALTSVSRRGPPAVVPALLLR